jgi:hypothetical protein
MRRLYIVLIVVLLAGCGPSSEQLTTTAVMVKAQTQTAAPTLTPTFTPTATSTPKPTVTPTATLTPTPSLAAVGETVQYNDLEISVVDAITHTQLVYGYSALDANQGYIFIDVAVLVRNRKGVDFKLKLEDLHLIEGNGDVQFPIAGGFYTVELERHFNPIPSVKVWYLRDLNEIPIKKDTYLRFAFVVKENQECLFWIRDSPKFAIPVH